MKKSTIIKQIKDFLRSANRGLRAYGGTSKGQQKIRVVRRRRKKR